MTMNCLPILWRRTLILSAAVALAACSSSSTTNDAQIAGGSGGTTSAGSGGASAHLDAAVASTGGSTDSGAGNTAKTDTALGTSADSYATADLSHSDIDAFLSADVGGSNNKADADGGSGDTRGDSGGDTTVLDSSDSQPLAAICDGGACTINFVSGSDWASYSDDPVSNPNAVAIGPAQPVCLNDGLPANCPVGALSYGIYGSGWGASLASIPGALWIWGAGISMSDQAALVRFYFTRTVTLGTNPSGTLGIAADDYAEVYVNGTSVGSIGSVTDLPTAAAAQSKLTSFDLTAALKPGSNTITIAAQNGPASFTPGCTSIACSYAQDPAGTVFGGSLSYQ
jgi:hypothetical protein